MTPATARAYTRLHQALYDIDRIGWLRSDMLRQAADAFRDAGRADAAELCERAAERFWGDDTALRDLEREGADGLV